MIKKQTIHQMFMDEGHTSNRKVRELYQKRVSFSKIESTRLNNYKEKYIYETTVQIFVKRFWTSGL